MQSGQAQLEQPISTPSFSFNLHSRFSTHAASRRPPPPIVTMNGNDMPVTTEPSSGSQGGWSAPAKKAKRPRPATIHEGFSYSVDGSFEVLPSWDFSAISQPTPVESMSRPISGHQDFFPTTTTMDNTTWTQKTCEDNFDMHGFDSDMSIGQAYTTDEAIPILDLRYQGQQCPPESESTNFENALNPRRMSGSSFTMSTSGGVSDMPSYEDFSAALSEVPSFGSEYPPSNRNSMISSSTDYLPPSNRTSMISTCSDYPPTSNRNSLMSSTQLSPVASPRMTPQSRSELVRTQSRGRASPSPRPGMRSAPYSVEGARNKRWSTGTYGIANSNRRTSPFVYHYQHDMFNQHARVPTSHSSPIVAHTQLPLNYGNLQAAQQNPYLINNAPAFNHNSMIVPSQLPSQHGIYSDNHHFHPPPPLLSHGLFRMLQSNGDPQSLHSHYADLSDPPDLYASLHEEQVPPPPEDMNPEDQDLIPHEQELRFEGDLYTPKWVRGHGNKREGWCGICKPGRWLVLKNSAFWYDKSFTHGVSAATGAQFQEPQETRRMDGNPDVWEGLCGSCNEWIALVSSKKKGTTWFRHAYKCHTHPKIKDAPKRRRESSHTRALAASSMAKPKTEAIPPVPPLPITPQMTPASMSVDHTPTPAHRQPPQQEQSHEQPPGQIQQHGQQMYEQQHQHQHQQSFQQQQQQLPQQPPQLWQPQPRASPQHLRPPPMLHHRQQEITQSQIDPALHQVQVPQPTYQPTTMITSSPLSGYSNMI